jgi:hypothetical protein
MSTPTLRRCVGSERFGIEAHEAPVDDFPVQPSQPDGLGRMCKTHWTAYTAGLRKDARARQAGEAPAEAETTIRSKGASRKPTAKAASRPRSGRSRKPSPKGEDVEQAEALIGEVDAMPADEMVKRVGDDDVQRAIEVSAAARDGQQP